jgi:hypothetical protein
VRPIGRRVEGFFANPYPGPRCPSAAARIVGAMTDFLTALGAGLGVALLVVMALVPALLALPPARRDRPAPAHRPRPVPVGVRGGHGVRGAA